MTAARQPEEKTAVLSPEQEAMVAAIARVFEQLLPKAPPLQIEAPKPKPEPSCILLDEMAQMHGVTVGILRRAAKAGRFFWFNDQGIRVRLSEVREFQEAWFKDLPKAKPRKRGPRKK